MASHRIQAGKDTQHSAIQPPLNYFKNLKLLQDLKVCNQYNVDFTMLHSIQVKVRIYLEFYVELYILIIQVFANQFIITFDILKF